MRLSDKATLVVIAAVVGCIMVTARCAPERGLPPKVQEAVIRHEVQTVIDTAAVHRLERAAAAESLKAQREKAIARAAKASADSAGRRADSLLVVASLAKSDAEAAAGYRQAELERHRQVDSLQVALDGQTKATAAAEARADSIAAAKSIETTRANRADATLSQVIPVAEGKDCRIARVITCPTRTQVAIGGILVGVVALAAAEGKIRIRLPLP
jgi:hypothetical protein